MSVYHGRFAPSPTGPLHQGSLFAALISYLEARSHHGKWTLRIENVDTQREQSGAQQSIINTLSAHGLIWDEAISYQSDHSHRYEKILKQLATQQLSYHCPCSRKQLTVSGGQHVSFCQKESRQTNHNLAPENTLYATKFNLNRTQYTWADYFLGPQSYEQTEDFVLKRKEGFYAYQLAVVCDDIAQGITHVIRGSDLLDSTPMQLALYTALNVKPPIFGHFPVLLNAQQQKLSKQTYAPAVDNTTPLKNLLDLFKILQLPINVQPISVNEALKLALKVWDKHYIPNIKSLKHTPST